MGDPLSVLAGLTRLGAPLVAAGHTMGIVALTGKHQDAFDASAEATIAAVAAQAAIALQLIAGAAHELNNPLASAGGYL